MSTEHEQGPIEDAREPTEEELRAAYEEQVKRLRVEHVVLETVVTLANLGMRRTGLAPGTEDERDVEQVRLAIESIRALMPLLEPVGPQQVAAIRDALSQLQLAFVRIGGPPAPAAAHPAVAVPARAVVRPAVARPAVARRPQARRRPSATNPGLLSAAAASGCRGSSRRPTVLRRTALACRPTGPAPHGTVHSRRSVSGLHSTRAGGGPVAVSGRPSAPRRILSTSGGPSCLVI